MPGANIVLVTGATGAIGPQVVRTLAKSGLHVRALVRTSTDLFEAVDNVEPVSGDILDIQQLTAAMQGCTHVVHLAALLHIPNPPPSMHLLFEQTNIGGTENVVAAAQAAGVRRMVFISTFAVYAAAQGELITEKTTVAPTTIYGQTKLAAEQIVLGANAVRVAPWTTVLRLTSVYGSRVTGNYERLLKSIARNRFVPIGNSTHRRTLVYDADVAQAIYLALQHPAAAGKVYNVTDGANHTLQEIIAAISAALGKRPPRLSIPVGLVRGIAGAAEHVASAAGRRSPITAATLDKYLEDAPADASLIQQELGLAPQYGLAAGWQATVARMRVDGALQDR